MHHYSSNRNVFGEALLAIVALGGFIALLWNGSLRSMQEVWFYAAILGIVAAFYAVLLFIRMIFTLVVGGDSFWWQQYEREQHWHKHVQQKEKKS